MQSIKNNKIEAQEAVGQLLYYHVYTTCLEPAFSLESFGLTEDGSYPCTMGSRGEVLVTYPQRLPFDQKSTEKKSQNWFSTHSSQYQTVQSAEIWSLDSLKVFSFIYFFFLTIGIVKKALWFKSFIW